MMERLPNEKLYHVDLYFSSFSGFLGSLFSLLQFLCCPLIGAVSDVFGRRIPMIVCMVRACLMVILF